MSCIKNLTWIKLVSFKITSFNFLSLKPSLKSNFKYVFIVNIFGITNFILIIWF